MKKISTLLLLASSVVFTAIAGTGNTEKRTFKDADSDLALEIERKKSEVELHILAKDVDQYENIVVERSSSSMDYFTRVKYIKVDSELTAGGGYIFRTDRYPLPATDGAYYRLKVTTKDGATKIYPPVQLNNKEEWAEAE